MALTVPDTPKVYTKTYSKFRGVDFSSDEVNIYNKRSPDAVNMMPDAGGNPYKRKGWAVMFNDQREKSSTQLYPASGTESMTPDWDDIASGVVTLEGTDTYTGSTQLSSDTEVLLDGSKVNFKTYSGDTATLKNSNNEEAGVMTFENGEVPSIEINLESAVEFGLADSVLSSEITVEPVASVKDADKTDILQSYNGTVTVKGGVDGLTVGRSYELRNDYGVICRGIFAENISYEDMSTVELRTTITGSGTLNVPSEGTVTISTPVQFTAGRLYRISLIGLYTDTPVFIGRYQKKENGKAYFINCEIFNYIPVGETLSFDGYTVERATQKTTDGFTNCTFGDAESLAIDNIYPSSTSFSIYSNAELVKITTEDIDKLTDGNFVLWQSSSNSQTGTLTVADSYATMPVTTGWLHTQVVLGGNTITSAMKAICNKVTTAKTLKVSTALYGDRFEDMWSFQYAGDEHLLAKRGNGVYDAGKLISDSTTTATPTPLIDLAGASTIPLGVYFNAVSGASFYMLADARLYKYGLNASQESTLTELVEPTSYSNGSPNDNSHIYIPTTVTGIDAGKEGGTVHEGVNLLTRRRINEFFGVASTTDYYVDSDIEQSATHKVIVSMLDDDGDWNTSTTWSISGTTGTGSLTVGSTTYTFTVDFSSDANKVTFSTAPPADSEECNVRIDFYAASTSAASEAFRKCTTATVYNNRVFFSGSEGDYKSYVWYSYYEKLAYIPDLNYFVVGDDYTSVMGLIDLGEYLGVIKESSSENSTVYLAYPVTFDENATYAVKQSITGVGAKAKDTFNSLNGEQLFLSDDGIYGISADMDEDTYVASTSVKNRSYYINKKLFKETAVDILASQSVVWEGFYFLFVGQHVYVLDGSQKLSWENDRTNLLYEAYYLELNLESSDTVTAVCVYEDCVYFATSYGKICRFKTKPGDNDVYKDNTGVHDFALTSKAINCKWSTVLDNDGSTQYYKNLQKKGTLVTIQPITPSTVTISIRKDSTEDEVYTADFEFSADTNLVPKDCYLNKKVKKYKRLQIIVENNQNGEGFGIQEIIKSYTIGNYSKNGGSNG